MTQEQTYDCRICGAHLDSLRDLGDHTRTEHTDELEGWPATSQSKVNWAETREAKTRNTEERL
jgi:hypothetical protein